MGSRNFDESENLAARIAPMDPKSLCTSCNYVLEFEENAHFIEKSQVRDRIANLLRETFWRPNADEMRTNFREKDRTLFGSGGPDIKRSFLP